MHIVFEELVEKKRFGGIETATKGIAKSLATHGIHVTRNINGASIKDGVLPNCVHFHGLWSPKLALQTLRWRRLGVPCVVTTHGMLEPWAFAHKLWKKRIAWHLYQRRLLNLVQALHSTSQREECNLRNFGLKPRIETIPWGIDAPAKFSSDVAVEGKSRNGLVELEGSLPNLKTKTAIFVGRVCEVKGLPLLVEAWKKVQPVGWKMKIVGADEAGYMSIVEGLVRKAGLEKVFEFAGELRGDDLNNAFATANLFILPSHSENFGMVIGEALGHSCPVIASQGCPWSGIIAEGCGWWPETSIEAISVALQEATSLDGLSLKRMGMRGHEWIRRDFSWESTSKQMIKLYLSLTNSNDDSID
jgi:glycosyltransferase involved in cell wall biosynthesis